MIRDGNLRLKGATGEGELFGLLWKLEDAQVIQAEWKEGKDRRRRIYKLTDFGRKRSELVSKTAAELACFLLERAPT
jgi:DNA-binding PadR family transcriptional regulator